MRKDIVAPLRVAHTERLKLDRTAPLVTHSESAGAVQSRALSDLRPFCGVLCFTAGDMYFAANVKSLPMHCDRRQRNKCFGLPAVSCAYLHVRFRARCEVIASLRQLILRGLGCLSRDFSSLNRGMSLFVTPSCLFHCKVCDVRKERVFIGDNELRLAHRVGKRFMATRT